MFWGRLNCYMSTYLFLCVIYCKPRSQQNHVNKKHYAMTKTAYKLHTQIYFFLLHQVFIWFTLPDVAIS